ncbi:PepSY-associated TM helix domain-containing protein [Pontibacter silvestris]|uniref:PepSY-associated TM helix domain-containing protein n=1 Tax=Pontibacter silvestris TaxID=2305183 RepID=A0ABW4WZ23_9BACT|nr:PepSY-associated TM helix domain-containing protein [Pontibacter silvestris]MCC9135546.1 PepSY domain-containing protein [Pontibacter silvestris]
MTLKKVINKIHLWLGLASGLLVLFLGITGCILAFQHEIESATQPYQFVAAQNIAKLPPSKLKAIADAQLPGKHAHSISYEKGKASEVVYYGFDPQYYDMVFLNPYNGEVLKVKNMNRDFFRIVIMGHYYLWLPPAIGQPIVAGGTLIFLILLITGIVLWWPKNKAARKQRFTIKWNAKWRRTNYDMHNVLGFYMTWVAVFIAITGLVMGFQWFSKSVYWVASGGKQLTEFYEPLSDTTKLTTNRNAPAIDLVWLKMQEEHKLVGGSLEVHAPAGKGATIETALNPNTDTYWQSDYRYFDQYTLQEVPVTHMYGRFSEASAADKIMRMNYDIHVGAIGGLAGKTIAFFASLLAASMPITGFLIWWGRRKKAKKEKPKVVKSYKTLSGAEQRNKNNIRVIKV